MREMLNRKEQEKQDIIVLSCRGKITEKDAAIRLKLSERQVRRLKAKVRGGVSLLHGNCGKMPASTLPPAQKQAILEEFTKLEHLKINFTHFTKLISGKWFAASYTAVAKLLKENGKTSSKMRKKRKKEVHKTRQRRAKFGELIQQDGTTFDWFDTGVQDCLHVAVDDATGQLTGLHISPNECLDGYFETTRYMLEKHGTPEAFYADGLSIFFSNTLEKLTIEEQLMGIEKRKTQFGMICDELGIELIHARTPQAKGRVERANGTLQGRLPVEFAIRNIKTIDEANIFLKGEYIDLYNAEFGVNTDVKSCFVPLPSVVNLDELLAWKTMRKVDRGGVFSLNNIKFGAPIELSRRTIELLISKKLGVVAKWCGKFYDVAPLASGGKTTNSDSINAIIDKFVHFHTLKNEHLA